MDYCQATEEERTPHSEGSTVTFYFTNFPKMWGMEALPTMFSKWGRVADVYVPKKKNKEGMAFGFVHFDQILSVQDLADRLQMIWIGLYKLRDNLSKFS